MGEFTVIVMYFLFLYCLMSHRALRFLLRMSSEECGSGSLIIY